MSGTSQPAPTRPGLDWRKVAGDLRELIDRATAADRLAAEGRYQLAICPESGRARVEGFDSEAEMVDRLRALRADPDHAQTQVFAFLGAQLRTSQGGLYLIAPSGRIPLFVHDEDAEVDESGYLVAPPPRAAGAADPADAEDDDKGDDEDDEFDPEPDDLVDDLAAG